MEDKLIEGKKPTISFGTKEDLEFKRQKEFLALSKSQRMSSYFRFLHESVVLYGYKPKDKDSFKLSMLNRETEF